MAVRQEVPEPRVPIIEARGHEARLQQLKRLFPEAVTEGKVNFDKLKALLDEQGALATGPEPYDFRWMGKGAAYRTISLPSYGTLRPCPEESVNFEESENLFIEGDNLEVMKILRNSYFEKIRMIYIDPPYNTGKEFIYPDNFREGLRDYLKYSGQIDDNGFKISTNTETNGRYHSKWLSMMYPRLSIAQDLLREDGVIFVSIDDNEVHNLRLVMNEIFGEENLIGCVIWNSTKSVTNTALISVSHTYNLIYAKEIGHFTQNRHELRLPETEEGFSNPDDDPRGPWKADPFQVGGERPNQMYEIVNPTTGEVYKPNAGCSWKNELKVFEQLLADNRIVFGRTGKGGPQRKRFLSEAKERGRVAKTLWTDLDTTANATSKLKELMGGDYFTNPKPSDLINRFCQLSTGCGEGIILDFFAGSCTTAHAVLDLNKEDGGNRQFICVQLPEPCNEKSEARNAGYQTIADIGKERIRRAIRKISSENSSKLNLENNRDTETGKAMGFKVFKLSDSNFKLSDSTNAPKDSELLDEQIALFAENLKSDRSEQDFLYEILLRTGQLLTAPIEKKQVGDQDAFFVNEGALVICLESRVTQDGIRGIIAQKPERVICLDNSFTGNDQLKTNTVLEMKSNSIHFQTI